MNFGDFLNDQERQQRLSTSSMDSSVSVGEGRSRSNTIGGGERAAEQRTNGGERTNGHTGEESVVRDERLGVEYTDEELSEVKFLQSSIGSHLHIEMKINDDVKMG